MSEQFISEPLEPVQATLDTRRMAAGEPGLPGEFLWRGQSLRIARVLRTWRETGPCRNGSPEMYVRKHWYEAVTSEGARVKIYFDRTPRAGRAEPRWWLFTFDPADTQQEPD